MESGIPPKPQKGQPWDDNMNCIFVPINKPLSLRYLEMILLDAKRRVHIPINSTMPMNQD
jgi:hypothetical protein